MLGGGLEGGIGDLLDARAIVEARGARASAADGIDEFPSLIVAEGDERITLAGIARAARPAPEFLGHRESLKSAARRAATRLAKA